MEQGCILDSNVVIYFLEAALNSSGKLVVDKATAAGAIEDSIVLPLNDAGVNRTIQLRKTYRKIKLPDAIIAATAPSFNLGLITRNTADFSFINGLRIIDPFKR